MSIIDRLVDSNIGKNITMSIAGGCSDQLGRLEEDSDIDGPLAIFLSNRSLLASINILPRHFTVLQSLSHLRLSQSYPQNFKRPAGYLAKSCEHFPT